MKQVIRVGHNLKAVVSTLLRRSGYKPTYRESNYRRPAFQRLTPLSRFVLILLFVVLLALLGVMANQSYAAHSGGTLLSDQLTAQPLPTRPVKPVVVLMTPDGGESAAAPEPASTGQPAPRPPTATPDYSRAPWAGQLFKQPDGTLMAPQKVIAKATQDLGGYYIMQRDLSIDDWLAKRDTILTTYFTDTALLETQGVEQSRDLYAMNRAGRFSIELRRFSPDGLTAKAGIITRDWVSDIYDVQSRQLVARGRISKDALTIITVVYDQLSGRWKFAHTDEVTELTP